MNPTMQAAIWGAALPVPRPVPVPRVGQRRRDVQPLLFHGLRWNPAQESLFDEFADADGAADE